SVSAGADERFEVTINQGVAPGSYRVRLDETEASSGTVRARAEVPFDVPDTAVTASVPVQLTAPNRSETAAARQARLAATASTGAPDGGSPSAVVVPKIATTTVSRGVSAAECHRWRTLMEWWAAMTRFARS